MRVPFYCAVVVGVVGHVTANAQAPDPDFSGVYVASGYVAIAAVFEPDVYPFTEVGQQAFDSFDPYTAPNQAEDCTLISMPGLIFNGDPMEIIQEEDGFVLHYERRDMRRTIQMDGAPPPTDQPHTGLGYSLGRWLEDNELVIETTHLLDGVIQTNMGHPLSRDARLTERYWRDPGEQDLHVELLIDDPVNYTETVRLGRELVRSLDDEVRPWGCVDLGPRGSEPDIDELVRMLEEL